MRVLLILLAARRVMDRMDVIGGFSPVQFDGESLAMWRESL